jgi:Fe2+ transport system protein B
MNRTSRNLCVLHDGLKIISDRQKKEKVELMATIKQEVQASANKDDCGLANEIHKLKDNILEQLSRPQHRKVTHDLTTNTWWLVGVGIVLFFLVFFLIVQIYDQSKEIRKKMGMTGTPSWAGHQKDYGTTII